jgi:hypothetical protein
LFSARISFSSSSLDLLFNAMFVALFLASRAYLAIGFLPDIIISFSSEIW